MVPISCANCWFNPLQMGAVGLPVGFCTRHGQVLFASSQTTCGLLSRKDLSLASALRENAMHGRSFSKGEVCLLRGGPAAERVSGAEADIRGLRRDAVGDVVADYGLLESTVESLAQLRRIRGARAEIAMLSLGRGYMGNCIQRGGSWTSGLHLYWWTRLRLSELPTIELADLREESLLSMERRIELAQWSLLMLRLSFITDLAGYAHRVGHALGAADGLLDEAALATGKPAPGPLRRWLEREARPRLDALLPEAEYQDLARALHREREVA